MINNVYLSFGHNIDGEKIFEALDSYTNIPNISFKLFAFEEGYEVKANEVAFYICNNVKETILNLEKLDVSGHSCYITSKPNHTITKKLGHPNFVGLQRHLTPISIDIDEAVLTLGDLKDGINKSEPLIREGENLVFDFSVLRQSEVNFLPFANPSGLFTEEVSQMFRYAGMSEVNRTIIIANYQDILLSLTCQLIWYYAEAAALRFPDHPYFKNSVSEYVVDMKSLDKSISFFKSNVSGRWWVKVPDTEQNRWKACSYEDYKEACNDELSNDLLRLMAI